jgi:hypothetical protein
MEGIMRKRFIWLVISCILALGMLLAACGQPAQQAQGTTVVGTAKPTATQTAKPTTSPTAAPTTAPAAATGPKYGGSVSALYSQGYGSLDPGDGDANAKVILNFVYNRLLIGDWAKGLGGTKEWSFVASGSYTPIAYSKGCLAESWEMPDTLTVVFHIRKGVRFGLDTSSEASRLVNGRELDANDIAYCTNRLIAFPGAQLPGRSYITSTAATDKWTFVVKYKSPYYDPVTGIR